MGEPRNQVGAAAVALLAALGAGAQAQSASCNEFKDKMAERIEASGVRGYALEIAPTANGIPPGARSVGTCDGGSFTVLYRRWASAAPGGVAASAPSAGAVTGGPRLRAPAAGAVTEAPRLNVPSTLPVAPPATASTPTTKPAPTPSVSPSPSPLPSPTPKPAPTPTPKATPAASPAPTPTPAAAAETELQRLSQVPFEFESPEEMSVGEHARVRLSAGAAASSALAGGRLLVQLSSPSLEIDEVAPAAGTPPTAVRTDWQWQVRAAEPGAQTLQLSLNAEMPVNGALERRTVRTFHRTIRVQAASSWAPLRFVQAHWPWLLALLLVPAAAYGWVWQARRGAYDEKGLPRGPKIRI